MTESRHPSGSGRSTNDSSADAAGERDAGASAAEPTAEPTAEPDAHRDADEEVLPEATEAASPESEVVETGGAQPTDDRITEGDETLQEQVDEARAKKRKQFGTFGGVFTPTLLTILGVIMFLRLGWVVGNAGIFGTLAIIGGAFAITALTGLAMSSIVTNIRIGAGGAYAIVSQSLGLEIGGALGIPRYISQALAITMYIFGLRAGWVWVFPEHPAIVVDLVVLAALWGIAYKSADLAIRVQFVIMAIIGVSLVSIVLAAVNGSMTQPLESVTLWGTYPGEPEGGLQGTSFWHVFAVFFPAATGIMAGANMSGDLKNPRRAIPVGTIAAIGVSLVIYLALAYWLARSATVEELAGNYTVMVDKAFWGPPVIAGLIGATFSSALASMVGSARILQAMGEHRVVPFPDWLARLTDEGEPRNAMIVTGAIVFATIMLRELNVVAPLITMFFLLTYAMICAVVLIEQSLNLVSFRPTLRIPRWVSLAGLIGSLLVMFIIHPVFSFASIVITVAFYALLTRRQLHAPFGDVRSGLFTAFAEWAAKRVTDMPAATERAWKPNLLVPVEDPDELRGVFHLLRAVTHPQGSVKLVGLATAGRERALRQSLPGLTRAFRSEGVFATWTLIETDEYERGLASTLQAYGGVFFRPNVLFLTPPDIGRVEREEEVVRIVGDAEETGTGLLMIAAHPRAALGRRHDLNVWVRDQSPDWELAMDLGDLDLALLIAYKLAENWDGTIRLLTAVEEERHAADAREYLEDLLELARIPRAEVLVQTAGFDEALAAAPQADVSVFGLPDPPDLEFVRRMVDATASTCVFVRDSGGENVLA
ncbi:MAG: amino acid permease [Gemmatimonadota bacterium]|nr:amino acid permease [Gemmatimonadota bacterium]